MQSVKPLWATHTGYFQEQEKSNINNELHSLYDELPPLSFDSYWNIHFTPWLADQFTPNVSHAITTFLKTMPYIIFWYWPPAWDQLVRSDGEHSDRILLASSVVNLADLHLENVIIFENGLNVVMDSIHGDIHKFGSFCQGNHAIFLIQPVRKLYIVGHIYLCMHNRNTGRAGLNVCSSIRMSNWFACCGLNGEPWQPERRSWAPPPAGHEQPRRRQQYYPVTYQKVSYLILIKITRGIIDAIKGSQIEWDPKSVKLQSIPYISHLISRMACPPFPITGYVYPTRVLNYLIFITIKQQLLRGIWPSKYHRPQAWFTWWRQDVQGYPIDSKLTVVAHIVSQKNF